MKKPNRKKISSLVALTYCTLVASLSLPYSEVIAADKREEKFDKQMQQKNKTKLVASATTSLTSQPNIILIVADDLGWGDLSVYGHPVIRTPNLDRMAAEGQRWTNFYVTAPICSPSRAAMLTGRVEARTGLYGKAYSVVGENDPHGFPNRETSIASVLKTAGYRTALFGKWHLGDAPHAYPTRHGFDYWWGLAASNDSYFVGGTPTAELRKMLASGVSRADVSNIFRSEARAAFTNPRNDLWNMPLQKSRRIATNEFSDEKLEQPFKQDTYSARLTDEVLRYISADQGTPFFAYVALEKPHLPHVPSKAFAGKSVAGAFGDVMLELDHEVGRILDRLRLSGKDRNTLVVFTSDNGPWYLFEEFGGSAGILRDAKFSTYEGGVRVPAIFWQPKTIRPAIVDGIASTLEFLPTFAALSHATLPNASLDGYDLSQTLKQNVASPRTNMPYYLNGQLMAWRDSEWKINFFESNGRTYQTKKLDPPTLYHLGRDPSEKYDVFKTEPETAARLTAAARAFEATINKRDPEFDRRIKEPTRAAIMTEIPPPR